MSEDERSITIRLEYRSDERTLIDSEVDEVHSSIIESVEKDLNIRRRF
jgi:phenylalanyl-tRNA synthetase beta chain